MVEPRWDDRGLVPAVVQDATTGAVLMVAWMNAEALKLTRSTGIVHFWSRSRAALWKKGETSGNTLTLVELRIDCDQDTILVRAHAAGPACHTGATTCFFTTDAGEVSEATPTILAQLSRVIEQRRDTATPDGEKTSYTKSLLNAGMPKILAKIAEEHGELAEELPAGEPTKVVHETADLFFHVMVGLAARGIPVEAVMTELARRFGTSGHVEKASRKPK
jgi:phosphoribosyl-ATP pyrophosphohydrolase/phosphoribosyl-AMP cyclohydrolase